MNEEIIKNYYSLLNNAKANWAYEDYEILINFLDLYISEKKSNENLELCLKAEKSYSKSLENDIKSLLGFSPNDNFISKSRIKAKIEEIKRDMSLYEEVHPIEILQELLEEEK